jgi:hypothetical protein
MRKEVNVVNYDASGCHVLLRIGPSVILQMTVFISRP